MADTSQINIANAKASDTLAFAVALLCCIFPSFSFMNGQAHRDLIAW